MNRKSMPLRRTPIQVMVSSSGKWIILKAHVFRDIVNFCGTFTYVSSRKPATGRSQHVHWNMIILERGEMCSEPITGKWQWFLLQTKGASRLNVCVSICFSSGVGWRAWILCSFKWPKQLTSSLRWLTQQCCPVCVQTSILHFRQIRRIL